MATRGRPGPADLHQRRRWRRSISRQHRRQPRKTDLCRSATICTKTYDMDASLMSPQQHGWGIHVVW